jgi:hypothetical protein
MDSCKLPYNIILIMTPARCWDRVWDRERGKDFDFRSRTYTTSYHLNSLLACFERINLRHSGYIGHSK